MQTKPEHKDQNLAFPALNREVYPGLVSRLFCCGLLRNSLLVLSCILLSACGFQLRSFGAPASSIQSLSLECSYIESWTLCHHLKQILVLNDISIVEDADVLLRISPILQQSRVLSLQANASAAEQGLSSEVSYQLLSKQDDQIKHQQSVRINNSYRHESSALLAKDRERDELQSQLSRQLAEEIVRQLTVLNTDSWHETPAGH